eukprot:COSAG01_NODE_4168_length_5274_cov_1.998261_7_plen_114_part_00
MSPATRRVAALGLAAPRLHHLRETPCSSRRRRRRSGGGDGDDGPVLAVPYVMQIRESTGAAAAPTTLAAAALAAALAGTGVTASTSRLAPSCCLRSCPSCVIPWRRASPKRSG